MKHFLRILLIVIVNCPLIAGNDWEHVQTPNYSPVNKVIRSAEGNLYAAASGLYMSADDGNSWQGINNYKSGNDQQIFNPDSVNFISIAASANGYLFAGMESGYLYRSVNGGQFWEVTDTSIRDVNSIVIDDKGRIFIDTYDKIKISTDNGATWDTVPGVATGGVRINVLKKSPEGMIYAGLAGMVLIYNEETSSFEAYTDGLAPNIVISSFGFGKDFMFAGTDFGLIFSEDNGKSWTYYFGQPLNYRINDLEVNDNDIIYAATTTDGIFYSDNKGKTWKDIGEPFQFVPVNDIYISGGKMYACSYGLFESSDSGINWTKNNEGLGMLAPEDIALSKTEDFYAIYKNMLFVKKKDSGNWITKKINVRSISEIKSLAVDNYGNVYVFSGVILYRTTDGGDSWKNLNGNDYFISAFQMDRYGNLYMLRQTNKQDELLISRDNGNTWEVINSFVYFLRMDIGEYGGIFVVDYKNLIFSKNKGKSWNKKSFPFGNLYGQGLAGLVYAADTVLFVLDQTGFFRSYDLWDNTEVKMTGLEDIQKKNSMNGIVYNYGNVWASMGFGGVYKTTDLGDSWSDFSSGLGSVYIEKLKKEPDEKLYAVTSGGIYRTAGIVLDIKEDEHVRTINSGVYPNPVIGISRYNINLNEYSKVSIIIYDMLGNKIEELAAGAYLPGEYSFPFDADQMTPGIYYIRAAANGKNVVTKFNVVK